MKVKMTPLSVGCRMNVLVSHDGNINLIVLLHQSSWGTCALSVSDSTLKGVFFPSSRSVETCNSGLKIFSKHIEHRCAVVQDLFHL